MTDRDEGQSVAVVYLARGQGAGYRESFERFRESYEAHPAGIAHQLYVIFKGYPTRSAREEAEQIFSGLAYSAIETEDLRYDIGAYADALPSVSEDIVCFLNTYSEIASRSWLRKLIDNLRSPGVGIVGATGTYESLRTLNRGFPDFPNPHLRTNAMALRRRHAEEVFANYAIGTKLDTFFIESGVDSLTQRVLSLGLTCLIVGADGRGYAPDHWPQSGTYRLGSQENLLVHDNYTREFLTLTPDERLTVAAASWGGSVPPSVVEVDTLR
ncbi:hypothetical protein Q8W71_24765 [Methylobacterium sp. NEAU 140]|uniref:hypothetical protein n=1 Tax=Methylobacterium sp. NEAU 140 TaxID=3064945 RepID=UPI0027362448|nr:hypothetical protein [Methylobacterium sp. NEAU 140]MDP4025848.1 hypothetical protein [Methylobacterium sp. NEAU 140]